jgi:heme oxygenase
MNLLAALRLATGPRHRAIETLPLSVALASGTIDSPRYAVLLGQLAHLHHTLEEELWPAHRALLSGLFSDERRRHGALMADLETLHASPGAALPPTLALRGRWRALASLDADALAGVIYVLEGSRLGSASLARGLRAGLPAGTGLAYHLQRQGHLREDIAALREALDALPTTAHDSAVAGAVATFDGLCDLYAAVGEALYIGPHAPAPRPQEASVSG